MLHHRNITRFGLLSMLLALIGSLLVTVGATGSTLTNTAIWTWTAPTQYTDGSSIAAGTVITYELFTGTSAGSEGSTPVWSGTALTTTTSGYAGGSTVAGYLKACIASLCSAPSSEATKSFPLPAPDAPSSLTVQ